VSTEYHAWNAGPRSCLGRPLATYEGITITAAILQRFDIELVDDSKVYEPLAAMNMVRFMFAFLQSPVAR
jgi:cytochrome P450